MATVPNRSIARAAVVLGLVPMLGCWCALAAAQQTLPEEAPSSKPPAIRPSEAPAETAEKNLVGLDVFSSDGTRVGEVRAVSTSAGGDVVALHVRTGGFLGFGGRTVVIPHGHFTRTGRSVRLSLDSAQLGALPEVKE
jgi:hypothetical protein